MRNIDMKLPDLPTSNGDKPMLSTVTDVKLAAKELLDWNSRNIERDPEQCRKNLETVLFVLKEIHTI